MANITGTSLTLSTTFEDNAFTQLSGALHLETRVLDGTTFVYATSETTSTINIFTMSDDAVLTSVGVVQDSGGTALNTPWDMRAFAVNGVEFLAVAGVTDDGITLFTLSSTVPYLTFADVEFNTNDTDTNLDAVYGIDVIETSSGRVFLYATGYSSNGISSFEVLDSGTLVALENFDEGDFPALNGAIDINAFELPDGDQFIAVAGYDAGGVQFFEVNADGTLVNRDGQSDILAASGAWESDVTIIGDRAFVYLAGRNDNGVAVVSFDGNSLNVEQSIFGFASLERARATRVIEAGDQKLLAILPNDNTLLQLYEIETNPASGRLGQLTHLETVSGNGLENSGDLLNITLDGTDYLIASTGLSVNSGRIMAFEVGGGDDILEGTQNADDITGGGGDDLIHGLAGDDSIDGGTGTDIIYAGSGIDEVFASIGNDRTYGGSGFDTFDARVLGSDIAAGITIDLFNEKYIQPGGGLQFITDFERLFGTVLDDTLVGNEKNNDLRGGAGHDTLRGREGNDVLRGQDGEDMLIGADGNDLLYGGSGNDSVLNGGNDNDGLYGEAGDDGLFGGFGEDYLDGGDDNDLLRGNQGDDTLFGQMGNDDLRGGDGQDELFGGDGDDFLFGENGNDALFAGGGDDTLTGGAGADVFVFGSVATVGPGFNTVKDFTNGEDAFDFSGYILTFEQIEALGSQKSWGTRFDFNDGMVVAVEGFNLSDFDISDLALT